MEHIYKVMQHIICVRHEDVAVKCFNRLREWEGGIYLFIFKDIKTCLVLKGKSNSKKKNRKNL